MLLDERQLAEEVAGGQLAERLAILLDARAAGQEDVERGPGRSLTHDRLVSRIRAAFADLGQAVSHLRFEARQERYRCKLLLELDRHPRSSVRLRWRGAYPTPPHRGFCPGPPAAR